ncbi:ABC transporter [Immersiella caudata]|uniref:ABC transporter n=1 Tax=Immersiella caudata TaxID=314043 RepID=A0AA39WEM7_9PEZI|nr:ABC transporter [Immersiella caudata]
MAEVSPSGVSCAQVDNTFGPHAGVCRGGFDFTLLFEETLLTILPIGLLVLALPLRGRFLLSKAKKTAKGNHLATLKLLSWATLAALQLAALILWTSPAAVPTRTSVAASAVSLVSTLGIGVFSYIEHRHTVRPSTLLGLFLFCTLLFDIAHTRTLWLRVGDWSSRVIAAVSTAAVAVKAVTLGLEAVEKRRLLRPEYRVSPPEATSGIYSRSFFLWLNPLFRSGFSRVLDIDDLFVLDKHLESSYLFSRSLTKNPSVTGKSPHSLHLTAFGILKWPIIQTFFPRACLTALMFCQPFLINRTIRLSQESITDQSTQAGYGLIGAYLLVYVGIAVSMGQYQHRTFRTITMLRGALISLIYSKTSTLQLKNVDPAASMTLMSADMERIVQGWQTMHEIWSNIAEVGIAIFLLEQQLGVACVVPVAVSLVCLLGSMFAMNFIMSRQAMWLEAIEKRISATSAMLSSIKGIKMCGLGETLLQSLQQLRVDELRISKRFRRLIIWNMVFAYLTQVFAPVLTFAVFSVRARDSGDKTLDTARVFTSLSLFALLSEPLASLVMALVTFLGAAGSFARIQEFLGAEERIDDRAFTKSLPSADSGDGDNDYAIVLKNADIGWEQPTEEKPAQLSDLTLRFPRHKLSMIIGPVGCGKSTLVQTLLGEIPALKGTVQVRMNGSMTCSSVAYCAQNAWHMNGTIRQAILGTEVFDSKWYDRVVHACALAQDFGELPAGDSSRIGSGGIALSGGQSQRIALARAVYARRQMVILDDTFSGLDTTTENHVFHSLLGQDGLFRILQATVIVVSSSSKRLPFADCIVHIGADGRIAEQGTFEELNNAGGYVSSLSLPKADWSHVVPEQEHRGSTSIDGGDCSDVASHHKEMGSDATTMASPGGSETADGNDKDVDGMSRRTGDVQIYLYYVRSVGWWATILFVIAITGFVFSVSFPTVWVQWWAAYNESEPNGRLGYWLGIYAMFGGVAIICLFLSCWQMIITMVPRSGEKFHFELLKTVISAPMSFFVNTDTGVTLNRFSQDLQLIDMELPVAALNTFTTFILCIAQMALIGVGSIYAAISFPIVLFALYVVQWCYLRTSRQLRLLDIEAKAPLYSLFEESLSGLSTIRAFGWQDTLKDKNRALLDRSQRPFYLLFAVQRWLTLVLDLIVAAVAVLLVVLVVTLRGTVSAGGVGLALLGVIQFSQNIKLLVTYWTMLETHIGSVARVRSFTETTVSEDQPGEKYLPPPEWPANGAIEIKNLTASYGGSNLVLKDLSLSIAAGDKIGICGRTGSGKTSLLMTLFRLVELQSGSISVDGIDIATVPRQEVRRRISGVPQQPFLLKGSVRLNADPMGAASDEDILHALECAQLSRLVNDKGGLDADIDDLNLSSGQRQLLGLARALLRPSSILILDEATSSIDARTEDAVQRVIRKKFPGHTIIAVAHRLDTIMDFDKVAVLDGGQLVEFDSPYSLLEVPGSAFSRLYNAAVAEDENDDDLEVVE